MGCNPTTAAQLEAVKPLQIHQLNGGKTIRILRSIGYLFSTIVMYLGIPVLGWGLGDLRGFFASSQRLGYSLIVLCVGFAVAWQTFDTPEGIRGGKGREDKLVGRQRLIRIAITLLLYLTLMFLPYADRRGIGALSGDSIVRWIGLVLFGLGIGLVTWSGVSLGKLYSGDVTLQEDHHLVTDGPYRWIRHPRYSGSILSVFGLSLTFNSWIGLVAGMIFIGIILYRINDEEVLMREAFGRDWEVYCERTHRLIPFVY